MKVLMCYSESDFRVEEINRPYLTKSDMLIEVLYCGLCGSDIAKIFDKNLKKPAVYGHEVVGRVVELGEDVKKFRVGDIVVCAHHVPCGKCHYCRHGNESMCKQFKETNFYPGGFSQYIKLSDKHIENTTFKIPENLDLQKALFVEPLACCIRAMERIKRLPGDVFSVVGAGAIGVLFVQILKLEGLKVVVIDIDNNRLNLAKNIGADYTINPSSSDLTYEIKKISPIGVDSVILTVTNASTLNDAIGYIRLGGDINIFGMSQSESFFSVDFGKIYKNELTIKSTYSSSPDSLARAFDLIISGKINVSPLIPQQILPLREFKKGLDLMLERKIYKAIYKVIEG